MGEFTPAPIKPVIDIEALEALDIRVGTIERVEEIAGSDKLMKLTVNFADHSRTILAGIKKERENPREIEGRQALFLLNLKPRKMAGEISEGVPLTEEIASGKMHFSEGKPMIIGCSSPLASFVRVAGEIVAGCATADLTTKPLPSGLIRAATKNQCR